MTKLYCLTLDENEILTTLIAFQTAIKTMEKLIPEAKRTDDILAISLFEYEKSLFESLLSRVKTLANEA